MITTKKKSTMKILLFTVLLAVSTISFAQKEKTYESLSNALANPEKVYKLKIKLDKTKSISDSIIFLKNLEELNLKNSQLGVIPNYIFELNSLKKLTLISNNLTSLPDDLKKLDNLEELDLSWNKLVEIPDVVCELKTLSTLNIKSNKLIKTNANLGNLTELIDLDLSWNSLKSLSESIGNLQKLNTLRLKNNSLITLPESIGNLQKLKIFTLDITSFTNFKSLPNSIEKLNYLENFAAIKECKRSIDRDAELKKERDEKRRKIQEEIKSFKYELTYTQEDMVDPKTGDFNKNEHDKLPWKIEEIYNYLKTKTDFIYTSELFSYSENKITETTLTGYKISLLDNKKIQSKDYQYEEKKYIKQKGMFSRLKKMISVESKNNRMKFMPHLFFLSFRVLDKQDTIVINGKNYICTQVEGFFMADKIKYWMVTNTPGLIVKIVHDDTYSKATMILKDVIDKKD